jgi:hypothetical protein
LYNKNESTMSTNYEVVKTRDKNGKDLYILLADEKNIGSIPTKDMVNSVFSTTDFSAMRNREQTFLKQILSTHTVLSPNDYQDLPAKIQKMLLEGIDPTKEKVREFTMTGALEHVAPNTASDATIGFSITPIKDDGNNFPPATASRSEDSIDLSSQASVSVSPDGCGRDTVTEKSQLDSLNLKVEDDQSLTKLESDKQLEKVYKAENENGKEWENLSKTEKEAFRKSVPEIFAKRRTPGWDSLDRIKQKKIIAATSRDYAAFRLSGLETITKYKELPLAERIELQFKVVQERIEKDGQLKLSAGDRDFFELQSLYRNSEITKGEDGSIDAESLYNFLQKKSKNSKIALNNTEFDMLKTLQGLRDTHGKFHPRYINPNQDSDKSIMFHFRNSELYNKKLKPEEAQKAFNDFLITHLGKLPDDSRQRKLAIKELLENSSPRERGMLVKALIQNNELSQYQEEFIKVANSSTDCIAVLAAFDVLSENLTPEGKYALSNSKVEYYRKHPNDPETQQYLASHARLTKKWKGDPKAQTEAGRMILESGCTPAIEALRDSYTSYHKDAQLAIYEYAISYKELSDEMRESFLSSISELDNSIQADAIKFATTYSEKAKETAILSINEKTYSTIQQGYALANQGAVLAISYEAAIAADNRTLAQMIADSIMYDQTAKERILSNPESPAAIALKDQMKQTAERLEKQTPEITFTSYSETDNETKSRTITLTEFKQLTKTEQADILRKMNPSSNPMEMLQWAFACGMEAEVLGQIPVKSILPNMPYTMQQVVLNYMLDSSNDSLVESAKDYVAVHFKNREESPLWQRVEESQESQDPNKVLKERQLELKS